MDFVFLGATNFSKVCASIVIFIANTAMTRTWSEIVGKSFYLILSSYILLSIANFYLSWAVAIVVRHFSIYLRQQFLISSNRFVKIHDIPDFDDSMLIQEANIVNKHESFLMIWIKLSTKPLLKMFVFKS